MAGKREEALSYAGKMLAMRMMTRKQLLDKLSQKGYCEEDSLYAVRRMEGFGAIDDLDYARRYVRSKSASGHGEMRIRRELHIRGVEPEVIEEALEEIPDGSGAIEEFIRSRAKTIPLDRREAKRISDALTRRGFLWEDISAIMQKYLEDR